MLRARKDWVAKRMGNVFISYRRSDAGIAVAVIDKALRERLGEPYIITPNPVENMEGATSDHGILPGSDWSRLIEDAIEQCVVCLVLIGPNWLSATDPNGAQRLFAPNDTVRWEIERALTQQKLVFPVLVNNAGMPSAKEMPKEIAQLSRRQALLLRPQHLQSDLESIVKTVYSALHPDELKAEYIEYYVNFVKAEHLPYELTRTGRSQESRDQPKSEMRSISPFADPERVCLPIDCQSLVSPGESPQDVVHWLQKTVEGEGPALLLAEYGMGKTYVMVGLFCRLAREYQSDPIRNPVPVFVRLHRSLANPLFNDPVEAVVQAMSFSVRQGDREVSCSVTKAQVEQLLAEQRLFVIFDGVDEIPDILSVPSPVALVDALGRLTPEGYSRWVVTSRTGVFARFLPYSDPLQRYLVARLSPWSQLGWADYVEECNRHSKLFASRGKSDEFLQIVSALPTLSQLTSTPLHARMLLEMREEITAEKLDMNLPKLFERYTDFVLGAKARVPAASEVRRRCFEAPAYYFFRTGVSFASRADLLRAADAYVENWGIQDLSEFFRHELQTYSLMHCHDDTKFSFSHSSFYQYFLSCVIVREMHERRTVYVSHMRDRLFGNGESLFLGQLLTLEENGTLREELQRFFTRSDLPVHDVLQQNAVEVGVAADCDLRRAALNGFKLHGLVLDKCDLSRASLQTAKLTNISMAGANMNHCNLQGARLDECNVTGTRMEFAILRGARISNLLTSKHDLPWLLGCDFGDPLEESGDVRVDEDSGYLLLEAVRRYAKGNQKWREDSNLILLRAIKKAEGMSNL